MPQVVQRFTRIIGNPNQGALDKIELFNKLMRFHWVRQHVDYKYELMRDGSNYRLEVTIESYVDKAGRIEQLPDGHPGRLNKAELEHFEVDYKRYVPVACQYSHAYKSYLSLAYDYGFNIPRTYEQIIARALDVMVYLDNILLPHVNLPSSDFIVAFNTSKDRLLAAGLVQKQTGAASWLRSTASNGDLLATLKLFTDQLSKDPKNRTALNMLVCPILDHNYQASFALPDSDSAVDSSDDDIICVGSDKKTKTSLKDASKAEDSATSAAADSTSEAKKDSKKGQSVLKPEFTSTQASSLVVPSTVMGRACASCQNFWSQTPSARNVMKVAVPVIMLSSALGALFVVHRKGSLDGLFEKLSNSDAAKTATNESVKKTVRTGVRKATVQVGHAVARKVSTDAANSSIRYATPGAK